MWISIESSSLGSLIEQPSAKSRLARSADADGKHIWIIAYVPDQSNTVDMFCTIGLCFSDVIKCMYVKERIIGETM